MPTADDRRRRRQPHPSAVATRGLLATRKCVRDALATCLAQRLDTGPRALDQRPALILGGLEPDITMLADAVRVDARLQIAVTDTGAAMVAQAITDGPAAVLVDARLPDVAWPDAADEIRRWRRDTMVAVWGDDVVFESPAGTVDLLITRATPPGVVARVLAAAVNAA